MTTAAIIGWSIYGVGFLVCWRQVFWYFYEPSSAPDDVVGYFVMAFFGAFFWPLVLLLAFPRPFVRR